MILNLEQKDKQNKNTTRSNSITTTNNIPCLLEMSTRYTGYGTYSDDTALIPEVIASNMELKGNGWDVMDLCVVFLV